MHSLLWRVISGTKSKIWREPETDIDRTTLSSLWSFSRQFVVDISSPSFHRVAFHSAGFRLITVWVRYHSSMSWSLWAERFCSIVTLSIVNNKVSIDILTPLYNEIEVGEVRGGVNEKLVSNAFENFSNSFRKTTFQLQTSNRIKSNCHLSLLMQNGNGKLFS